MSLLFSDRLVLTFKLGLFRLLHVVLSRDLSDLLPDLINHPLLLLLELVLLHFKLLRLTDDLFLLTVKLFVCFAFFSFALEQSDCLHGSLTYQV